MLFAKPLCSRFCGRSPNINYIHKKQLMPVIKQQNFATTSTLLPKRITYAELVHKID
ncbi:hypothetical protein QT998_01970 [Microcoleus sp. S1D4]|uniref:hypothetical protein n=1 Tax=Microcoleus sp. CZ3-B4 TaxID=2818733 RepID=UPI002FD47DA4